MLYYVRANTFLGLVRVLREKNTAKKFAR